MKKQKKPQPAAPEVALIDDSYHPTIEPPPEPAHEAYMYSGSGLPPEPWLVPADAYYPGPPEPEPEPAAVAELYHFRQEPVAQSSPPPIAPVSPAPEPGTPGGPRPAGDGSPRVPLVQLEPQPPVDPYEGVPIWDKATQQATSNYYYTGDTVQIKVDTKTYSISRARLGSFLPALKVMFELPQADQEPIVLYNTAQEFEHFLWFIHVDPMTLEKYASYCPERDKVGRNMSIAAVAHMYEATELATWALQSALDKLPQFSDDCTLILRAYQLAERCVDLNLVTPHGMGPMEIVCDTWRSGVKSSDDPTEWLMAARQVGDHDLMAYAYFHLLSRTNQQLEKDIRLTPLDLLRLHVGIANLRRFDTSSRNSHSKSTERTWVNKVASVSPDDSFGKRTLWDMFTRSPMGFSLADESLDLSSTELSSRGRT